MTTPRTRHPVQDPEPHGRLLLLRGDLLTPEAIARAADDNLRAFGFPGVSLVAGEADGVEQVLRHRLRRYEWVVILTATMASEAQTTDRTSAVIDLPADLNNEDDHGNHWSFVDRAPRPDTIRPGAIVTAGDTGATATVEILTVDPDGFVTFRTLD